MGICRVRVHLVPVLLAAGSLALFAPRADATIVYGCGLNLCTVAPDGTGAKQLTTDGTSGMPYTWPSLSRDGSRMSFIRNGALSSAIRPRRTPPAR